MAILKKENLELDLAREYYEEALYIRRVYAKKYGQYFIIDVAQTLYNLSLFYSQLENEEKSHLYMLEAVGILNDYIDILPYVKPYYINGIEFWKEKGIEFEKDI